METVDISKLAKARQRIRNGALIGYLLAFAILTISLGAGALKSAPTAVAAFFYAGLVFALSRGLAQNSRKSAVGLAIAFVCPLGLATSGVQLGIPELGFVVFVGYFIVQGIRGVFFYRSGPRGTRERPAGAPMLSRRGLLGGTKSPRSLAFLALTALAFAVAGGMFLAGPALSYSGSPQLALLQRNFGFGVVWHSVALGLTTIGGLLYRYSRQHAAIDIRQARGKDTRPPVLLLRSFRDDMVTIMRSMTIRLVQGADPVFEEVVTDELWTYGPVIAIGRPGERIPSLGAARDYVSDDTWQEKVESYISEAVLILLIIGETEGLGWEFRKIVERGAWKKLILVFPPAKEDNLRKRWSAFSGKLTDLGAVRLPREFAIAGTLLMTFGQDGSPHLITGSSRSSIFYEEAIRQAVLLD